MYKKTVKGALREKIAGLKNKYWKEVFDNLDKMTSRLTSKSREAMLEKLMLAGNVDFDESNVYSVMIWAVKNANIYFDRQLVEVFKEISDTKGAKPYKSNEHFKNGTWRSMNNWDLRKGKFGAYTLDYRFVKEGRYYGGDYGRWDVERRRWEFITDIMTIANNLGFQTSSTDFYNDNWEGGELREIYFDDGLLFTARLYKNGNIHLKFDQDFMAKLNIEAGRLLGWLTSPKQAEEETGIKPDGWNSLYQIEFKEVLALAA